MRHGLPADTGPAGKRPAQKAKDPIADCKALRGSLTAQT